MDRPKPDIVEVLKAHRDDPMWADHAEIRKDVLHRAIDEIETLRSTVTTLTKFVADLDKDQKELLRV